MIEAPTHLPFVPSQVLSFLGVITTDAADAGFVSRAFNILHILLHLHALSVLRGQGTITVEDNAITLPPFLPVQLLVLIQPLSILLQSAEVDWIQFAPPPLASLVAWVCISAMDEGRRAVEALGGLMYAAKGA